MASTQGDHWRRSGAGHLLSNWLLTRSVLRSKPARTGAIDVATVRQGAAAVVIGKRLQVRRMKTRRAPA